MSMFVWCVGLCFTVGGREGHLLYRIVFLLRLWRIVFWHRLWCITIIFIRVVDRPTITGLRSFCGRSLGTRAASRAVSPNY